MAEIVVRPIAAERRLLRTLSVIESVEDALESGVYDYDADDRPSRKPGKGGLTARDLERAAELRDDAEPSFFGGIVDSMDEYALTHDAWEVAAVVAGTVVLALVSGGAGTLVQGATSAAGGSAWASVTAGLLAEGALGDALGSAYMQGVELQFGRRQEFSFGEVAFYTSVGGVAATRDANGNLRDDGTHTYEYDYRNQLCRVALKSSGATVAEYGYDVLSRRIARTAGGSTTIYAWSGTDMMAIYDSAGLFSRLHYGAGQDEIVGAHQRDLADLDADSSTTDFVSLTPMYDGAYDCVGILGPSGAVAERYVHDFQGRVTVLDAAGATIGGTALGWRQGYGRMWRDDDTSALYARRRWYSPTLGRAITSDPAGCWLDSQAVGNRYAWVGNSYRNGWDPSGLDSVTGTSGKGDGDCPCDRKETVQVLFDTSLSRGFWSTFWYELTPFGSPPTSDESLLDACREGLRHRGYDVEVWHFDRKGADIEPAKEIKEKAKSWGQDPCVKGIVTISHGYANGYTSLGSGIMLTPRDFGDATHAFRFMWLWQCSGLNAADEWAGLVGAGGDVYGWRVCTNGTIDQKEQKGAMTRVPRATR